MNLLKVLALGLVSCNPCVMDSGLFLKQSDWNCSELEAAHDKALELLKKTSDPAMQTIDLSGWWLNTQPNAIPDPWGRYELISGYTDCPRKTLLIYWPTPMGGPLLHEIAHAVHNCLDENHENWDTYGLWSADADFINFVP